MDTLESLKKIIDNVISKPEEEKYRSINMDSNFYKLKIKPSFGFGKKLLVSAGFIQKEDENKLVLSTENNGRIDLQRLKDVNRIVERCLFGCSQRRDRVAEAARERSERA